MINPKKITTKIEKAFSNHFSANKINVGQEKYSHYPFLKSHKDIGEKEVIKAQLFIPKKKIVSLKTHLKYNWIIALPF